MEMLHDRTLEIGQKVRVYVNLHKQGRFSIVDTRSGLVCGYASSCLLEDAHFYVSPSGREKVRKTKHKMVHAWVRGIFKGADLEGEGFTEAVSYNPYKNETFIDSEGEDVHYAEQAYFTNKKVYLQEKA
ncbi:hypothetical protein ACQKJG_17865 [Priestia megaterium]|uniref:hypothetical protein n=1 Tax=Priestia megaterium TaxID=1404 RepID=UPI003CFCA1A0